MSKWQFLFQFFTCTNTKIQNCMKKKRSIMAQKRLKYFFLSNYLIGEISGHNYRMIGKTWVSMGLDTPPCDSFSTKELLLLISIFSCTRWVLIFRTVFFYEKRSFLPDQQATKALPLRHHRTDRQRPGLCGLKRCFEGSSSCTGWCIGFLAKKFEKFKKKRRELGHLIPNKYSLDRIYSLAVTTILPLLKQ